MAARLRGPLGPPLREAELPLVCETAAESVLVVRKLLRSDDEKVRRDAAQALIDLLFDLTKLELASGAEASITG